MKTSKASQLDALMILRVTLKFYHIYKTKVKPSQCQLVLIREALMKSITWRKFGKTLINCGLCFFSVVTGVFFKINALN